MCAACRRCDFTIQSKSIFPLYSIQLQHVVICCIVYVVLFYCLLRYHSSWSEALSDLVFADLKTPGMVVLQVEVLDMEELGMEVARPWQRLTMAVTCCRACLRGSLEDWSWRFSSFCRPCLSVESRLLIRRSGVFPCIPWSLWMIFVEVVDNKGNDFFKKWSKEARWQRLNSFWIFRDFQWREVPFVTAF